MMADGTGMARNTGSSPPMPSFDDFYRAINDRDPFPWQERLANQVTLKVGN